MNTIVSSLFKSLRTWTPQQIAVRFREKKPEYFRRYGYEDPVRVRGLLPRIKDDKVPLPMPEYKPANSWCEKRALFGQNDYIDILGDGTINPVRLMTNVPFWLRGFKGNEYRRLLRKKKCLGGHMKRMKPTKYNELVKRMKFLHSFMNRKLDLHR